MIGREQDDGPVRTGRSARSVSVLRRDHRAVKAVPVRDPCHRRTIEAWVDELSTEDCWSLASATPVGRVGFVRASRPIVVPVNHIVDDATIVFRTDDESVLGDLSPGERVAFEVDDYDDRLRTGWSVMIAGEVVSVARAGRMLAVPPLPWAPSTADRWWRIEPDHVTGRRVNRHRLDADGHFLPWMPPD